MRGKNLLNSLFQQYSVSLNGVTIPNAADFYYNRAYLASLLSYGNEADESLLTNTFYYRDTGDLFFSYSTAAVTTDKKTGFLARCDRLKQNKEIEIVF